MDFQVGNRLLTRNPVSQSPHKRMLGHYWWESAELCFLEYGVTDYQVYGWFYVNLSESNEAVNHVMELLTSDFIVFIWWLLHLWEYTRPVGEHIMQLLTIVNKKNTSCSTPVLKHYCVNEFEIMQNYSIMLAGGVAQFHHSPWLRSFLNSQEFLQHFD